MSRIFNRRQISYLILPSVVAFVLMVWSVEIMGAGGEATVLIRGSFLLGSTWLMLSTIWLLLVYRSETGIGRPISLENCYTDLFPFWQLICVSALACMVIFLLEDHRIDVVNRQRVLEDSALRRLFK